MIIVCKNEEGAIIYTCEGIFDAGNALKIGDIYDATPMWAINEGDDSQIHWSCNYDTRQGYASGDTFDACLDEFVRKVGNKKDVEITDMPIDEFAKSIEEGAC